jgi:5-methylthioadenosine/S-adenosylhomocysteine deaminase
MIESLGIRGATIITMDDDRTVIPEGTVVVDGGRFVAVERGARDPKADRLIDGRGQVLLPGLINCHMHTRPGRALGDGLSLFEWHALYPDGLCRLMTPEDSRAGGLAAFAESLKGGTTTAVDMTCKPSGAVAAAEEIGIRAVIVPLAADADRSDGGACDAYQEVLPAIAAEAPRLAGGRVQYWLGFDAINGVSEATLRQMSEDARRLDVGIHGHMSESRDDTAWAPKTLGIDPAAYLARAGILGARTILAHCNWLTEDEIRLLASSRTSVSHNPTSNMKLGTGVCPVGKLHEAGVNVGLGTDGMLSNFHLDMFEVMRGACMLQRIHNLNAAALSSWQALEMATRGGARAVGLGDELGVIAIGRRADAILVDFDQVHLRPRLRDTHDNLVALLVWCAHGSDVTTVMVDGRVVVEGRRLATIPEQRIARQVQESAERLVARIAL